MFHQVLSIEDFYTDSSSAGLTTKLGRTEIVNRLLNVFICNFKQFNFLKMRIEVESIKANPEEYKLAKEELEEYTNKHLRHSYRKLRVWYDEHPIDLKRVLDSISRDTHLNTKVFSPVAGCPIGCDYCFSRVVVNHFKLCEDFKKQEFRGPYAITKDADGNDVPELFYVESEYPVDWFVTYMSDYGYWEPEWQENVLGQVIAASNLKRANGKAADTFQFITKFPKGIRLDFVPRETDLRNVVFSCTVDNNHTTDRIIDLISSTKDWKVTTAIVYQPVREYISPVHLDEYVQTFGRDYTWVVVGGLFGRTEPFQFEWVKDIIDKCIELDIPVKMEMDIRQAALDAGYEFLEQEPMIMREANAIRKKNLR